MDDPKKLLDTPAKPKSRVMRVFMSSIGTCNYPFASSGKLAHFINGVYLTDLQNEIFELEREIELGHPHIYIDAAKREVDILADPLQAIRDKAIADYIAQQEELKAQALAKDMGTVANPQAGVNTGIGTTANVGTMATGKVAGNADHVNTAITTGNGNTQTPVPNSVGVSEAEKTIKPPVLTGNARLQDIAARARAGQNHVVDTNK